MAKVSIKNLERYGDSGWEWTEVVENSFTGDVTRANCHTNRTGEGLWYDDRQVLGTCQFSLPRNRKAAYNKIWREALKGAE